MITGINSPLFLTAFKALHNAQSRIAQSLERLSTGKQLNRASDNPSGLVVVDYLRAERVTINEEIKSADRANYVIRAADGAMGEIQDLLLEVKGLVSQAANESGLSDEERQAYQDQVDSILGSIDFLHETAKFNGDPVLGSVINVAGTSVVIPTLDVETLGLEEFKFDGAFNLVDGDMEAAAEKIDQAINKTSTTRAHIGSYERTTISSEIAVLQAELEATVEAESDIVDADFAKETAELAQAQLLEATAMAALEIAQDQIEMILDLLTPAQRASLRSDEPVDDGTLVDG